MKLAELREESERLLSECGLKHDEGWITFFTAVTFHQGVTQHDLHRHIHSKMKDEQIIKHVRDGKLRLLHVATTFGSADAMIIWQTRDDSDGWKAAKDFRDDPGSGIGTFSSLVSASSDGWR